LPAFECDRLQVAPDLCQGQPAQIRERLQVPEQVGMLDKPR
jgi:hypothetical protein